MEITGLKIKRYIENHKPKRQRMIELYNNYRGKDLEIEGKSVSKTSKANNKLKNDYRGIIIDQITGYLFGKPISFSLDSLNYPEHLYQQYNGELKRFMIRNNFEDLTAETGKMASICGYGAWLCYLDNQAKERLIEVNPWEVIFIEDDRTGATKGAIYYYPIEIMNDKGETETRIKAEFYNDENITFFISDEKGNYKLDNSEDLNPRKHLFKRLPFIKVSNNSEELGDFEKVEELINKYDFLLSTVQDEIDQFRLAYMLITGAEVDEATLERVKESGAFSGLEPEDKIEFITKQINDVFIENHKKTLNENIYKFSSTIDMSDEKFSGGGESGESRKWKLITLENKAIIKERKFSKALRELFEVICSSWNENKNLKIDYLDIYYSFSRNVPIDLIYLADVSAKLKGMVSEDTRLSVLGGLVDDIEWEKEKMREDASNSLSLDDYDSELINPSEEGAE